MRPNNKIKSAQKWVQENLGKKNPRAKPSGFEIEKFSDLIDSKIYLGSNANLIVCAKSAKCILVILSDVEANAAFTVPFKATI